MKAVQFDQFGGVDVLQVREVPDSVPAEGEVVVRVRAAATNPGEIPIREGRFGGGSFPSGQGSDLAGVVSEVGPGVSGLTVGDEVVGWSEHRNSQAELVAVPTDHLVSKPPALAWEVAGSAYVIGVTSWAAAHAVGAGKGDVVVVSAAAGGVGSVLVQYLRHLGAEVVGVASENHHDWLRSKGVVAVSRGRDLVERIRAAAPAKPTAFVDTFGGDYVRLAVEDLGVDANRVDTIIDFEAAKRYGARAEGSMQVAQPAAALRTMVDLMADGTIEVPIAATYALDQVRDAYEALAERHTLGKIVLLP